jgi:hypothetical protein
LRNVADRQSAFLFIARSTFNHFIVFLTVAVARFGCSRKVLYFIPVPITNAMVNLKLLSEAIISSDDFGFPV